MQLLTGRILLYPSKHNSKPTFCSNILNVLVLGVGQGAPKLPWSTKIPATLGLNKKFTVSFRVTWNEIFLLESIKSFSITFPEYALL